MRTTDKAQIPLVSSRHLSTRIDTFDVSSPCIWPCRACRTARLDSDTLNTTSATGATRNL